MLGTENRVANFKIHLENSSLSDLDIVRQFLCFGIPYIFKDSEEDYYKLKHEISKQFNIHPNEILMVGSAKLGFSIVPDKLWKHFDIDSDIDIAIISEKAFNHYWEILRDFDINIQPRNIKQDNEYQQFLVYLFKGWLRPDKFNFKFEGKNEWFSFFKELKPKIFKHREYEIRAGIYKDFKSFELYHCKNIKSLRNRLQGG